MRRGAAHTLYRIIKGLGQDIIEALGNDLMPFYRLVRLAEEDETDDVVRYVALIPSSSSLLTARSFLFPVYLVADTMPAWLWASSMK